MLAKSWSGLSDLLYAGWSVVAADLPCETPSKESRLGGEKSKWVLKVPQSSCRPVWQEAFSAGPVPHWLPSLSERHFYSAHTQQRERGKGVPGGRHISWPSPLWSSVGDRHPARLTSKAVPPTYHLHPTSHTYHPNPNPRPTPPSPLPPCSIGREVPLSHDTDRAGLSRCHGDKRDHVSGGGWSFIGVSGGNGGQPATDLACLAASVTQLALVLLCVHTKS